MHITKFSSLDVVFVLSAALCAAFVVNASTIRTIDTDNDQFHTPGTTSDGGNFTELASPSASVVAATSSSSPSTSSKPGPTESNSISSPPIQTLPMLAASEEKNKSRLLKCHCDVCREEGYTCETDGLCFTSVEVSKGQLIYSYRCLQKKYELERLPIECLSNKEKERVFRIECCETDFCNNNVLLRSEFKRD